MPDAMEMYIKSGAIRHENCPRSLRRGFPNISASRAPNLIIKSKKVEYNSIESEGAMQNPNGNDSLFSIAIEIE
jgi:hypothetical protein